MLELATLGLLQGEPLHGYRLKQQLELFMSGCISVNYGAIYPMLKRLEQRGAISVVVEDEKEGGSSRKIYSITNKGRELWRLEMMKHPHESWTNARSRFGIKFFFFSHLEPAQRIKLLDHRLMICRLRLENLEMEPLLSDPYQSIAWQRFMGCLREDIQWLSEQLTKERGNRSLEGVGCDRSEIKIVTPQI